MSELKLRPPKKLLKDFLRQQFRSGSGFGSRWRGRSLSGGWRGDNGQLGAARYVMALVLLDNCCRELDGGHDGSAILAFSFVMSPGVS